MMRAFLCVVACIAALAACMQPSDAPDSLAGTYTADLKGDGHFMPFLKVSSENGGLVMYEFRNGDWRAVQKPWGLGPHKPEPVRPFTHADLEKLVKHPVGVSATGIQTDDIALVRVPAGWSDEGKPVSFRSTEGYFAISLLGPIDLHKAN
jgi:hypothetical protein